VETRETHGSFNAEFAADCDATAVRATILEALREEASR
jgi:purine nucleosidase